MPIFHVFIWCCVGIMKIIFCFERKTLFKIFRTNVHRAAFLKLHFGFVIFLTQKYRPKDVREMLMKLRLVRLVFPSRTYLCPFRLARCSGVWQYIAPPYAVYGPTSSGCVSSNSPTVSVLKKRVEFLKQHC